MLKKLKSKTSSNMATVQIVATLVGVVLSLLVGYNIISVDIAEEAAEITKKGVLISTEIFDGLKGLKGPALIFEVLGILVSIFVAAKASATEDVG